MAGYLIGGRLIAGGGLDAGEVTLRAIPANSVSVELPLNDNGSIDVDLTLPMVDPVTGVTVDIANELIPGRDWIGWVEGVGDDNDVIIEAGPIWGDPFEWVRTHHITSAGLWSYFDHRLILPILTTGQVPREVTTKWTALSLPTIAKRIVQLVCSHPSSGLPINYEPDLAGDQEREYPGGDLEWAGEALRKLTEVEGGPDIAFRPVWGADRKHVRWSLITGRTELKQAGEPHYWDTSVEDPHAYMRTMDRDGSVLTSREIQTGANFTNILRDPLTDGTAGGNYSVTGVTIDWNDSSWSASGDGDSFNLYSPTTSDSFLSVGGATSTRLGGLEDGKTYTFTAIGNVKQAMSGSSVTDPSDAAGQPNLSRARALVVHARVGSSGYAVWHSPQVPNVVDSPKQVSVTFTVPPGSTELFLRAYHGQTAGQIRWDAFALHEGDEGVPGTLGWKSAQLQAVAEDNTLLAAGYPLLESVTNRSSVKRASTLRGYAVEAVTRGAAHLETFTFSTRRDKYPVLGTYWPGDYADVVIGRNPRVPADKYRVRIMSIAFGKTGDVSITCAPLRASGYPVPLTPRNFIRSKFIVLSERINESLRGSAP